jgi:hypothetical protein
MNDQTRTTIDRYGDDLLRRAADMLGGSREADSLSMEISIHLIAKAATFGLPVIEQ